MHSVAILCGLLVMAWGIITLFLGGMLVDAARQGNLPRETLHERRVHRVVGLLVVPLLIGLVLGGGALIRWGIFTG
jgi:hypothetical protein